MPSLNEMVEAYRKRREQYETFANSLRALTVDLLQAAGIDVHTITSRTKEVNSLAEKLRSKGKHYKELQSVTDLAGIRIITYFADDVDRAADVICKEFEIDEDNSVDKRQLTSERSFGYQSLHLVGKLKQPHIGLAEYKSFRELSCEFQVRSMLQHAWAEIEHNLGYKNPVSIPQHLRRRFAKLAAILELADDEFERLRNDFIAYGESVMRSVVEEPEVAKIDRISLQKFLEADAQVRGLIRYFSEWFGKPPVHTVNPYWIEALPRQLPVVGISTVGQLKQAIVRHEGDLKIAFEVVFEPLKKGEDWSSDMVLFALALIMAVVGNTKERAEKMFDEMEVLPGRFFFAEVRKILNSQSNDCT